MRRDLLQMDASLVRTTHASRGVRVARAALAAETSLSGMARGHPGAMTPAVTDDGRSALTGVSIAAPDAGRDVVELHLVVRPPVTAGLVEAVIQQVREVADDRDLGPYVDRVSILFEDFETCGS
jgi:hypothetical protein